VRTRSVAALRQALGVGTAPAPAVATALRGEAGDGDLEIGE
jgi:hypothetical protein